MSAKILFLVLIDAFILVLACVFSGLESNEILKIYFVLAPIILFMFFIEGLYTFETYDPAKLSLCILRGTAFATVLGFSIIRILSNDIKIINELPVLVVGLIFPYMIYLSRKIALELLSKDFLVQNAVLIGAEETVSFLQNESTKKPFMGYRIKEMIRSEGSSVQTLPHDVKLIAIQRNYLNSPTFNKEVMSYLESGVELMDLAYLTEKLTGKIPLTSIDESWFIEYCGHEKSSFYAILKRSLDIVVSVFLMIALIPFAALLIPLLILVHGKPIFFKQTRTGLNQKPFTLYKLRTMVLNAEKDGAQWSKPGDARITPLGKWLRKTRIDELPQLWNILKGEMSLVGPRPERPEIIKSKIEQDIPYYNLRHLVKPGVTGWAQVSFRYGFSMKDTYEKLEYDLFYVKNRNILLDIIIILKTIKTVVTGAGQ